MEYEFIDDMFERLLVRENRTFGDAFKIVVKERAAQIVDLGKIENAYQLFRKKHPSANENYFREFVKVALPGDYEKCVRCFNWK